MTPKIDWDNRIIYGRSGLKYSIEPENLSTGRYNEYVLMSILLAQNTDFETMRNDWVMVDQLTSTGNNVLGALTQTNAIAKKNVKAISELTKSEAPRVIKYCALVCVLPEEDVDVIDPIVTMRKYEDWKGIPISDFFLLQVELTKGLRKHLASTQLKAEVKEK